MQNSRRYYSQDMNPNRSGYGVPAAHRYRAHSRGEGNMYGDVPADYRRALQGMPTQQDGAYPYGPTYPPAGFGHSPQMGLVTEHMLRRLDESRMMTMAELMRRTYGMPQQPYVTEPVSPQLAIEGMHASRMSKGNGDWRNQIEHITGHLVQVAQQDQYFRRNLGEPQLGELSAADLEELDDAYRLILTFDRPHGRRTGGTARTSMRQLADATSTSSRGKQDEHRYENKYDVPQLTKENEKVEGTLKPAKQFSAEADAEALRKAMKGVGTDEDAIVNVLGKRSNLQRQEIIKQYKTAFGKDLVKDLKGELSGEFWKVIRALCLTLAEFDATELRNAIKGVGTNDACLIEIICTRSQKALAEIKDTYKKLFSRSLEQDILDDTSGHYQRLLVSLLQANRDEKNVVDRKLAADEARILLEAGAKKWGTDESRFNKILVSRSYAQLRATFAEYEHIAGKSVQDAISAEMSGDLAKGMSTIIDCINNKPAYFAHQLYKAMKGLGTSEDMVTRIIVSRCEVDMVQIKEEFKRVYKQSLAQFVADDTSGDYRKILMTLLAESNLAKA